MPPSVPQSPVTDVHTHLGRTVSSGIGQDVDTCLATMDRAGIARAVLSVAAGGRQVEGLRDTMGQNDAVADAVRAHPTRFPVGLAAVEIRHEEWAALELERALSELGLRGLVVHPTLEGVLVGGTDRLDPLLDLLDQHAGLCLMHATRTSTPASVCALAARWPHATFLLGHPSVADLRIEGVAEEIATLGNVYVDVAYQDDPGHVEAVVALLGAERVFFGSDSPFYNPTAVIGAVHAAHLSDADRDRLLRRNGEELITRLAAAHA